MKGLIDRISGRERILTAFSHSIADRLPVFDVVNNPEVFRTNPRVSKSLVGRTAHDIAGKTART